MRRSFAHLRASLNAFGHDRRGVSAVEFALIAPLMIMTYFGLAELADGMMAKRRVSHATSAIGDLVAQTDKVATADVEDIFSAAEKIVSPYPVDTLRLRITSISGNSSGQPRVDWSDDSQGASPYGHCGSVANLPSGLIAAAGDNVVMAEATYTYNSPVGKILPNAITFSERYYLKPRKTAMVKRDGASTTACNS